jgi:DNA modification methylase
LDCFVGSGSTLVAAKKLNRQFIGIEKEKEYYDICLERLK